MDKQCRNCKYFYLHYIRSARGKYSALIFGHCIKPRIKKRFADEKACSYWEENKKERS